MTEEQSSGGLHIDSDWKEEARREKERLAEQEASAKAKEAAGEGAVTPGFLDLVNMLAMQVAMALGGLQGPGGERIPPNLHAAKHHIDLMDVLAEKTKGNLTDEEKRALDGVLYELRMHFVQLVNSPPGGPEDNPPGGAPA